MILTCPTCASRYNVDETKLGPQGRTVRCAGCGGAWRAEPVAEPLQLTPELEAPVAPIEVAPAKVEPSLADAPAEELPKVFRQQAEAKRRTREAVTAGVVWASMSAGLALLLLSAVVFRVQVVRLWPRTAGAYAAVRLTVNPLGVAPDSVQAAPGLENGRAALIVTGAERNVDSQPRAAVPLLISLYDKGGARLLSRMVDLAPTALAGGERRPFKVSFLDPPIAAAQVGVDFAVSPRPPATRTPRLRGIAKPAPQPRLRGELGPSLAGTYAPLPPASAQPIPEASPYALPAAARAQRE